MARRLYALALILVCSLQSTGAASASTLSAPNMRPLLSALQSTWIFAVVTGQSQRYAAMHAPEPTPAPLVANATRPAVYTLRSQPRTMRQGVEFAYPGPLPRPNVAHALPDPLAMAAATSALHRGANTVMHAATPQPITRAKVGATAHAMALFSSSKAATTGVNPWWTYEEGSIPGFGKDMVNVSNGNLIVQADDVDVPERGIYLAFRRTYNSQSQEGQANADGSGQGIFGEGWTNNFDERIAYDAPNNVMSVFDLDGARYDYKADGNGGWTPPPGMQGTSLSPTSSADCYYYWKKKSGTVYVFNAPNATSCMSAADAGMFGRLAIIYGRNSNNLIQVYYSFTNSDRSSISNLSRIRVADAGVNLTMTFTTVNGQPELASVTRPDGQVLYYYYTSTGNLAEVTRPGNAVDDVTRNFTAN